MNIEKFIADNLKEGEFYAGLVLGKEGQPSYHMVGLPGELDECTWSQAMDWAKDQGGELPNLRELGLLRVNAREHFKDDWYWSSEQRESGSAYARGQNFNDGSQDYTRKSLEDRARAVRRIFSEV